MPVGGPRRFDCCRMNGRRTIGQRLESTAKPTSDDATLVGSSYPFRAGLFPSSRCSRSAASCSRHHRPGCTCSSRRPWPQCRDAAAIRCGNPAFGRRQGQKHPATKRVGTNLSPLFSQRSRVNSAGLPVSMPSSVAGCPRGMAAPRSMIARYVSAKCHRVPMYRVAPPTALRFRLVSHASVTSRIENFYTGVQRNYAGWGLPGCQNRW